MNEQKKREDEDPVHFYPGTAIRMFPGDILYSHKYAFSSFLVGHIAIIGENYRIYHINRWKPYGHADSMPVYLSRHKKGEKLTILRHPQREEAKKAAKWTMQNYDQIKRYIFTRDLLDLKNNYCSKFIWQAFYFGNEGKSDLLKQGNRKILKQYVMPGLLYRKFKKIASFNNLLYQK
ncbi:hypothetical protein JYK21_05595 [Ralstonia pickettii]|nr:hypothetical protein [Ralstonia pickettii]